MLTLVLMNIPFTKNLGIQQTIPQEVAVTYLIHHYHYKPLLPM